MLNIFPSVLVAYTWHLILTTTFHSCLILSWQWLLTVCTCGCVDRSWCKSDSFSCSVVQVCIQVLNDYAYKSVLVSITCVQLPSCMLSLKPIDILWLTNALWRFMRDCVLHRLWNWGFIWVEVVFRAQKQRISRVKAVSREHIGCKFKAI